MRRAAAFALPALLLAGCAAASQAPAQTDALTIENRYPLEYATQFTVDVCAGGYDLITIDGSRYLVVPEGPLRPPIWTQTSPFCSSLSKISTLCRLPRWTPSSALAGWGCGAVRHAGRKLVPRRGPHRHGAGRDRLRGQVQRARLRDDPVRRLRPCHREHNDLPHARGEGAARKFGVPVLVERSSYESDPLARMEWVKLYGILLGRTEEAERIFDDAVQRIAPLLDEEPTGKTAAFFSITSNNLATVRKGGDYVAKMIGLAGGSYVFADLTDSGNNLATVNISLEDFYAGARDADVLLYNSTIEGELRTMDELLAKCPMLADFKAVQSGSVWCTSQSLFQQSMELPDLILDMNRVFTEDDPDDSELTF
ncbi:ABC transporter substrate-binding protein [Gemmiger formicilis]|nr:ABC transporter substrate-binding protein [Gemmiger formicilis]